MPFSMVSASASRAFVGGLDHAFDRGDVVRRGRAGGRDCELARRAAARPDGTSRGWSSGSFRNARLPRDDGRGGDLRRGSAGRRQWRAFARQRHVADHAQRRMLDGVGRRLVLGGLFRLLLRCCAGTFLGAAMANWALRAPIAASARARPRRFRFNASINTLARPSIGSRAPTQSAARHPPLGQSGRGRIAEIPIRRQAYPASRAKAGRGAIYQANS